MEYKKLKANEQPEYGIIYSVPKSEAVINSDLRTINEKDKTLTEHLLESVKKNGILMPISVWCTKDDDGNQVFKIITGNRRVWCANKIKKIENINVVFKECENESDYMRQAYHSNVQKASKVNELMKTFKVEVIENGLSVRKVASSYGVSEKSVYSALRIVGNEKLEVLAKINFKNAVHMSGNKSFLDNKEIAEIAKTGTITELKEAISNARKKIKLAQDTEEGKELVPEKPKMLNERKRLFFEQLSNYKKTTIVTTKLIDYVYGKSESWNE